MKKGMLTYSLLFSLLIFSSALASNEEVIEFRRWLVPEKMIPSLSQGLGIQVNRQRFERWINQLDQRSGQERISQPHISQILLKARLEGRQLVQGEGTLTLSPRSEEFSLVPIHPLGLAAYAWHWQDDREALVFCDPASGIQQLIIPPVSDSNAYEELQYQWSLQCRPSQNRNTQSRNDAQQEIVFDLTLPPCLYTELHLELPDSLTLTSSAGLVLPCESQPDSAFRTWKILLGHHSQATLSIKPDESVLPPNPQAVHQILSYTITPQGLETLSRISFDEGAARPNELVVELESPLHPIEVRYGNQPVPWTQVTRSQITQTQPTLGMSEPSEQDVTEIQIDLSSFSAGESQELTIQSLGPLRENERWLLPRVRLASSDGGWASTRCTVSVYSPLRVRNLICSDAVQVPPRSTAVVDWTERELYVFQFFQENAQMEIEVIYSIPPVKTNSAAQIYWSNNEIRSTVFFECSITEGERFMLHFPISENWVVDSVAFISQPTALQPVVSSAGNPIFSWDILESTTFVVPRSGGSQTLSVQLNRPLRPRFPMVLQLSCRFINSFQNQFQLAELSPFAFPYQQGGVHAMALQTDFTDYSLRTGAGASAFSTPPNETPPDGSSWLLGAGQPVGIVYPLNIQTRNIHFEQERTRSQYSAEIFGKIAIDNGEMIPAYRIRCIPADSPLERVFIHFTPFVSGSDEVSLPWRWSLAGSSEALRSLRSKKLSPDELKELMPNLEPQNRSEDISRGEVWEIHLDELQTAPFELLAESSFPLSDTMTIPFASLLRASQQKGELTIESIHGWDYRISSAQRTSIPIAPSRGDQYQTIRAAFRYDPQEEQRRSQYSPLTLQHISPAERENTAWIWSLRLDTQYEAEGIVRNKALFLVENKGKESLNITLPAGIDADSVSSVWRDSVQIPWQYRVDQNEGKSAEEVLSQEKAGQQESGLVITVPLPAGQRFVSIYIEYLNQDVPLSQRRKLRPDVPSTDAPVIAGHWISWFPPEFEVSLRHDSPESAEKIVFSKAFDHLLSGTYRSYLGSRWDAFFHGRQRQKETEAASQCIFEEIVDALHDNSLPNPIATWGDLIGSENTLSAIRVRLARETQQAVDLRFLVDKEALAFLGITPAAPIEGIGIMTYDNVQERLFDRAGLMLLATTRTRSDGIKEYTFALTTPTTLSRNQRVQSIPVGHCVRMVPFEIFDAPFNEASSHGSLSHNMPEWITSSRWISETVLSPAPWSVSAQVMPWSVLTSDWNAYELPITPADQPLYIVHRQKFLALQWVAFLLLVLLTCRKPFSSPMVLIPLLMAFEVLARFVPPCYVGITSGAFLGVLVSLCFVLIRSRTSQEPQADSKRRDDSTECSVSFVHTPLHTTSLYRLLILGGMGFALFSIGSASAQTLSARIQPDKKEPYRIFYPMNSEGRMLGENVWAPVELIELLNQNVKFEHSAASPPWSIVKAVYQGSLVRSAQGQIECSEDFKAVYDIYLTDSTITVTLPPLPATGKFYWDSEPIWRDETQNGSLSFLIENALPGKHTLEIVLSPQILSQNSNDLCQLSFAIPAVPDSTLLLNVPPTMPAISIPDAIGRITPHSTLLPVFSAELGAAEQLALHWEDDPSLNGMSANAVEQLFWIKAKPSQTELHALFRFRIAEGKIRRLWIQTDPRWGMSGQFSCDEQHPFVPYAESYTPSQPDRQTSGKMGKGNVSNVTQIEFASPVSGIITLRATFLLRNFDGIGNIRLPDFKALRATVTKSWLGVSANSTLELNGPVEGRINNFDAVWQEITLPLPMPFDVNPFWNAANTFFNRTGSLSPNVASPTFTGQNNMFQRLTGQAYAGQKEETTEAAYDLTQIASDWTLGIRAKKTEIRGSISQSVQFESGLSQLHVTGTFTSESQVFAQSFSSDLPVQIETVEVRNERNEIIESHWQKAAESLPAQYRIFFRQPVSDTYSITVKGFFGETLSDERVQQTIPLMTFDGIPSAEHTLHFFRTSSVIASLLPVQKEATQKEVTRSGWTQLSAVPTLPDTFASSTSLIPIGTWQKVPAPTTENEELNNEQTELLVFSLSPNRPNVHCKTVLSLHALSEELWKMNIDFTSKIETGELESLSFQWDERCGTISPIEPAAKHTLHSSADPSARASSPQILTITPAEPMQGEQHFRFSVTLNTSDSLSLPNVFPLAGESDVFESEIFVNVPAKQNDQTIPWTFDMLEPLEQLPSELFPSVDVNNDKRADGRERLYFRAADTSFSAASSTAESGLTALFYDIGFLIRQGGTVIGLATIDIRNRGQESFIMQMPPEYELLQMDSAGLIVERTPLPQSNRWRIRLGMSDYPQRINILFRTALPLPAAAWNRERIVSHLQFPFLEGVTVQDTLWIVAFEESPPALNVDLIATGQEDLGNHVPLFGREAALSLIGFNLIREHNLIRVLNTLPVSAQQEEAVRHWYARWSEEWNALMDKVDYQVSRLPIAAQNIVPKIVSRYSKKKSANGESNTGSLEPESLGIVRTFLRTMSSKSWEALKDYKNQSVREKFGNSVDSNVPVPATLLNSQVYWQERIAGKRYYLFGAEEGGVQAIRFTSLPQEKAWTIPFSNHVVPWICLSMMVSIAVLISVRWVHPKELWLQFPHFWGMALGVLLWIFLPESFIGISVIVLTILSFFRPAWSRRRS